MVTIRILLALLCFVSIGSSWRADRSFIKYGRTDQSANDGRISDAEQGRKKILAIAEKEIGVQESHENSGARVDTYNAYVGLKKVPWCASFVSWVFGQAGYAQPCTAWSPALFPGNRLVQNPLAGMVLGMYFPELKRIAHCGIIAGVRGDWIESIEGNTSINGSREGTGVFRRTRHKRTIRCYADWL
jgi:hypothetical protein